MNEKPKRKLGWRLLRWGLIGLAVLITLAAVLVTEENWRGKRAWENYKRAAEAHGERFEWSALLPVGAAGGTAITNAPGLKDFVKIQFNERTGEILKMGGTNVNDFIKNSASHIRKTPETNFFGERNFRITRDDGTWPKQTSGDWTRGRLTDLKIWQEYYRTPTTNSPDEFPVAPQPQTPAKDVLLALSKYDADIEKLRGGTNQMLSLFAGSKLDESFISASLEYYSATKSRCQVLQLRAVAELADEQPAAALEDIQLMLRLDDEQCQMPLLIAQLVGIAETAMTLQPVYEGLAQHRWNDAQLAELEQALAALDMLSNYPCAMRGERAFAITTLEDQRTTRAIKYSDPDSGKVTTISLRWTPSAFFYRNELSFAQMYDQFMLPLVDMTNRTVSVAAYRTTEADFKEAKHWSLYNVQARMIFPAVGKAVIKFALIQSQVDLARTACALERFSLAHGNYPETLDALVPQFIAQLPHDIINGKPLHYRRTDDGKFVLYSVGWDEKDDGGKIVLTKGGSVDREKGDWVWQYPQK
ncbi:MAG: hypothetical protein PHY43_04015 [Verrucomicrobiales bacterium]|nr:hypothetical protein [Verrucomicrobiales bacterium]